MVKKSVATIIFSVLLISVIILTIIAVASAQQTEEEKIAKAYEWLINQVRGKWQNLNIKQHVFSLLALQCNQTYFAPGNSSLYAKSFADAKIRCWGTGPSKPSTQDGCLLTETALAKVALDEFNHNSSKVTNWLLSRNMTQVQGINWYLEIDVDRGYNASCEIIYGGVEENIFEVTENKTVKINGNSKCFYIEPTAPPNQPYFFKIKENKECFSYRYTIKCWSSSPVYRATLLYRKTNSVVWHVSSETASGKPGVPGSNRLEDQPNPLELEVKSYCLANPGQQNCDYEGTAWTAYALAKEGNDKAKAFVPYLVVFVEDNIKFFPESFLYPITKQERYNNDILAAQKAVGIDKGYWLIQPIVYGRVYDTAHAGLALETAGGEAITKAKNYLLANQEANGNLVATGYGEAQKESIRDTAFALWVFWAGRCPGAGGPGIGMRCTDMGYDYRCTSELSCEADEIPIPDLICDYGEICCKFVGGGATECSEAGGSCKESCNETEFEISEIICPDWKYCCKAYENAYCNETGGEICESAQGEECYGKEIDTIDGKCCLGSCVSEDTSNESCFSIGSPCETNEVCINKITWSIVDFTETRDSNRCCVGTSVECVQDVRCSSIGEKCDLGEECVGTVEKTKDAKECCRGECLESCSKQGGIVCKRDEECTGTFVNSVEGRCCINGKCKKPTSLWWIWIIVIIIIGGAAAYYFLVIKKKPVVKEKPSFEFPIITPVRPSARPIMPISKPMARAPIGEGAARTGTAATPIKTAPRGLPPRPSASTMPPLKPAPMAPKLTPKEAPKPKGKTESELEKTLKKLKKMSK
ncbi:MAG: hypothetical protein N3G19_01580 [Candidatus Pacearchaeota archaeon]|nr:hypothetical protein [Candidatus Pacearchaeota archaeon]